MNKRRKVATIWRVASRPPGSKTVKYLTTDDTQPWLCVEIDPSSEYFKKWSRERYSPSPAMAISFANFKAAKQAAEEARDNPWHERDHFAKPVKVTVYRVAKGKK